MSSYPTLSLSLPSWVADIAKPRICCATLEERMRLTIALAAHNVESDTGGPFGAAIFERDSGVLIAPGINMVRSSNCSVAHAEAVAIALAQQVLQTYDLGASHLPALELVTSAQPCIQCFGNVWWSGVKRLVTGASLQQTEALTGFDEGPVPLDWAERLRNRKPHDLAVEVIENVLADEACQVLASYQAKGGIIY